MTDPTLFSGMPVLLKSELIEDAFVTDLHSLRTVKMKFDDYGAVRFGESGEWAPNDVLLAVVRNTAEEEVLANAFRRRALAPPKIWFAGSQGDLRREIIDRLVELLRTSRLAKLA